MTVDSIPIVSADASDSGAVRSWPNVLRTRAAPTTVGWALICGMRVGSGRRGAARAGRTVTTIGGVLLPDAARIPDAGDTMRRAAPPPRLRVDTAAAPPLCRVGPGPAGLRLVADEADPGAEVVAAPPLALALAGPLSCDALEPAQGGRLVVGWSPGVVRSIGVADVGQMFDRRPAGLCDAVGAAGANAALLRADDGWRAVVLPSLGDRLADLGDGPVAIAPDGLTVAAATPDGVVERAMADGAVRATHPGGVDALAYTADGRLWAARAGAIGAMDGPAGDGARSVMLRAAAAADVLVALAADGSVRVRAGDTVHTWAPPLTGVARVALSADGTHVLLCAGDAVAVCRAADGALALRIRGARAGALLPDGRLVISGDWGVAAVVPVTEGTR